MTKLTPQEAFEHVKALWPDTVSIRLHNHGNTLLIDNQSLLMHLELKFDWPPGITEWPPQPKWEEPVLPDDWGKLCELSHDSITWQTEKLAGFTKLNDRDERLWRNTEGRWFKYCRIDRNKYPRES